jgi:hypothetical protein
MAALLRKVINPTSKVEYPTSNALSTLTPALCNSGAAALAWWSIRDTELASHESAAELRDVYRQHRLSALRHEADIVKVLSLLRGEGIEAVLVKGWAIARHYPDQALRPYGDIDLCVSPIDFPRATEILKGIESINGPFVDLHTGFDSIGVGKRFSLSPRRSRRDRAQVEWDEIFARTRLLEIDGPEVFAENSKYQVQSIQGQRPKSKVRVMSDEDHLRLLCAHLLRSGARRPLWLCDIAVLLSRASAVEGPKSSFDWSRCLTNDNTYANYVQTAVLLACELLGLDISYTPFANQQLPRWVPTTALTQWGKVAFPSPTSKVSGQKADHRRWTSKVGPWRSLYRRWNNPVRATAAVGASFSRRPRFRDRLRELIVRLPEVPHHLRALIQSLDTHTETQPQISQLTQIRREAFFTG